jgi:hypothetical protein
MVQEDLLSSFLTVVFACISIDGLDIALDTDISFPPLELPEACARISVSEVDEGLSSKKHEQQAPIIPILLSSLFSKYNCLLCQSDEDV